MFNGSEWEQRDKAGLIPSDILYTSLVVNIQELEDLYQIVNHYMNESIPNKEYAARVIELRKDLSRMVSEVKASLPTKEAEEKEKLK